jgi:hypothetical protein
VCVSVGDATKPVSSGFEIPRGDAISGGGGVSVRGRGLESDNAVPSPADRTKFSAVHARPPAPPEHPRLVVDGDCMDLLPPRFDADEERGLPQCAVSLQSCGADMPAARSPVTRAWQHHLRVLTNLMHCPWFLKPKALHVPFLHWILLVGLSLNRSEKSVLA